MKEKSVKLYFMFWESGGSFFHFSEKKAYGGMDGTGRALSKLRTSCRAIERNVAFSSARGPIFLLKLSYNDGAYADGSIDEDQKVPQVYNSCMRKPTGC